jgi:hypothetical protein
MLVVAASAVTAAASEENDLYFTNHDMQLSKINVRGYAEGFNSTQNYYMNQL